ncbi:MAG TPA: hypothetical protein VFX28_23020 [Methylomirabilota bacterium]|nr:hypothetical protein [Methylomirabilota bacterium]
MSAVTGVLLSCPCGEVYELRPELAGRLLECPACGRHLRAGRGAAARAAGPAPGGPFDRDVFLLRQRALAIRSKYEVWAEDGTPVLFVERPTFPVRTALAYGLGVVAAWMVLAWASSIAHAERGVSGLVALAAYLVVPAVFVMVSMSARPLRHVTVWRDESRREVLLRVLQDQRVALLTRTYTVVLPGGEALARLRKSYLHNVLRKRWYVETPAGRRVAVAVEDSIVLSLLRRVLGPLFGVLRTNFVLLRPEGEVLGELNRKLTLLDRYVLDLTADPERTLDRRVALALGIMLDTGERR